MRYGSRSASIASIAKRRSPRTMMNDRPPGSGVVPTTRAVVPIRCGEAGPPTSGPGLTSASFLNGRLVMSSSVTPEEQLAQLELPDKAIWAAPSFAAMRILADRDGALARLHAAARAFDYGPLRPAATAYVRQKVTSS